MPLICIEVATSGGLNPICGCIFYCGFGENLKDAMTMQRETIVREVNEMKGLKGWLLRRFISVDKMRKQYDDLMAKVNSPDEPDIVWIQGGLVKQPAKWLREHMSFDSHDALKKYMDCHCLAITGKKDIQVHNEFCIQENVRDLLPNVATFKVIEGHRPENLTHALRSLEGESKIMNMKTDYYILGKLPLDEELLLLTDDWIDKVLFHDRNKGAMD